MKYATSYDPPLGPMTLPDEELRYAAELWIRAPLECCDSFGDPFGSLGEFLDFAEHVYRDEEIPPSKLPMRRVAHLLAEGLAAQGEIDNLGDNESVVLMQGELPCVNLIKLATFLLERAAVTINPPAP
jgi:hypothetical protein